MRLTASAPRLRALCWKPALGYMARKRAQASWDCIASSHGWLLVSIVGSLDLIGNPATFFSDVGGGVKDFYYEPRKGLVKSPSAFTYVRAPATRTSNPNCMVPSKHF